MKLPVFSVVGEALNFGARRMETIMRVAWLPVVLLLVLNMTTVFAALSIAAGRLVTFADVRSFAQAEALFGRALALGWLGKPGEMATLIAASAAAELVLVAAFMAPLIRLAGLGERPRPGLVRLEFGPAQLRYIVASLLSLLVAAVFVFAPAGITVYFVLRYVGEALAETYATFPNPESLHTIEIVTRRSLLEEQGRAWLYDVGAPLAAVAPFALVLWIVLTRHFTPKNRARPPERPNLVLRALATLFWGGALVGLVWLALLANLGLPVGAQASPLLAAAAIVLVLGYYVSLRLFAWPGVAVCRGSLAPGGLFKVTRGWNIARLFAALIMVSAVIFAVQWLINMIAFPALRATINYLFAATETYTRLVDGGETGEWVRPVFAWVWNGLKILYNVFWTFFSYGVSAGLFGRLYRESERAWMTGADAADAAGSRYVWTRAAVGDGPRA
ncbi:hypothetical protein [Amphiplicatus metriothermophilus]|uniref:Uncharacterized protein n=1 Tax=Amphiplicatus metriothermophilus TaxID=1519374 RepID=A0A239PSJ0_9PROT|nr:hypothetical protein [Amphiplicatus metriothermophilus]MBB5519176.1 MFS family permease [Amphiplicatus metriothermophilus]SNT73245.1 hypothetical protein SAMN06297382_1643 [Amphiplicatus metriothermophilus]